MTAVRTHKFAWAAVALVLVVAVAILRAKAVRLLLLGFAIGAVLAVAR